MDSSGLEFWRCSAAGVLREGFLVSFAHPLANNQTNPNTETATTAPVTHQMIV